MTTPFFRSAFAVLAFVGISVLTARAPLHAQVDLGLGGPPGVGGSDGSPKVTWSFSVEPKAAAPGDEVDVVATYKVETGWHIYAPDFVGTGKPTELKIEGSSVETSGTLRFPKPTIKRDDLLEETHRILKKGGDLRQKVRLAKDASGEVTIGLSVSYMSCDANNCLPPSTKKGQVVVQIGAAVAKANGADSVAAKPTEAAPTEEKPKTLPLPKPVPLPGIGLPGGGLPGGGVDIGPHAKWKLRIEPANARPGGKVEIIAEYEVSDGYYIYSPDQPPKESYPTRFELGSD
ncbi:MAG: protein-disulfide reductase DsbD domain-containing protein, partial [Planctomycetota bacterium]